jgi:hypothetical protein
VALAARLLDERGGAAVARKGKGLVLAAEFVGVVLAHFFFFFFFFAAIFDP